MWLSLLCSTIPTSNSIILCAMPVFIHLEFSSAHRAISCFPALFLLFLITMKFEKMCVFLCVCVCRYCNTCWCFNISSSLRHYPNTKVDGYFESLMYFSSRIDWLYLARVDFPAKCPFHKRDTKIYVGKPYQ